MLVVRVVTTCFLQIRADLRLSRRFSAWVASFRYSVCASNRKIIAWRRGQLAA